MRIQKEHGQLQLQERALERHRPCRHIGGGVWLWQPEVINTGGDHRLVWARSHLVKHSFDQRWACVGTSVSDVHHQPGT